ncbi:hypothetical protein MAH1_10690 [Sessilibacter sp. MAH1]
MEALIGLLTLPFIIIGLLFWWLPIIFILFSGKVTFAEKLAWILLTLFVSWFAWIFFMLLAPIKPKRPDYY